MFNNMQQMESADTSIMYLAKVVDNNDPTRKGRVKVSIPNKLENNHPWVNVLQPVGLGSSAKNFQLSVPKVGSIVVVRFEQGDTDFGMCIGSLPGFTDLPEALSTNYPNRYGFVDTSGNEFVVDTTEGSSLIQIKHKSGTTISVNNSGKVTIIGANDLEATSRGTTTIRSSGATSIESSSTLNLKSSGAMTIQSGGNMKLIAPRIDADPG